MIARIGRLVRVELMKLASHPFLVISLALVLTATFLAARVAASASASPLHPAHAVEIFAAGSKWGLNLVSYVLLISGALLFAGEFDRGTIKLLLTRPITRTEVFLAKGLSNAILAVFLMAAVLSLAWGMGCWRGELGPVWDPEEYVSPVKADALMRHLGQALGTALPSIVAFGFLGILLSNIVESSGHAVAMALILAIGADVVTGLASSGAPYWTKYYSGYAFDTLSEFARGKATRWRSELHQLPWSVPLITSVLSLGAGFAIFKRRNITA